MQRHTDRDPTPDRQEGSLVAARQFVSSMQSEALYVSFLLTGERQAAVALAEAAFLQYVDQTGSSETDGDGRTRFLLLLGKLFLRGDYKERIERDLPVNLLAEPAPARYGVDNRRTLLLAALGRLNDRERLALLLNDLSGLDSTTLNAILERRNEPLLAPMETARQRVRQSVDIPQGEPLRPVLVEATFDAPKLNLWPRLEEPMADIQSKQKQRQQIMSYGIVGLVFIVLVGGIVVLFGGDLLGSGDAAETVSGSSATDEITAVAPAATPALQPPVFAPTATPEPATQANVPSWFLLETMHDTGDAQNGSYRSLTRYDAGQNAIDNLFVNEIRLAAGSSTVQLSPNGYQMSLFREETTEDQATYFIDAFSTENVSRQWETELLTINRDPNTNSGFNAQPRFASAHTEDRVYAAVLTTGIDPSLTIHELFHRNGKSRGMVEIELPAQTIDTRTFQGNIFLYAPEGSDSVYLVLETFGDSTGTWRATLYTIDRAELTIADPHIVTADAGQEFWFWDARPTIDGRALYGLRQSNDGSLSQMQFLDLETGERMTLDMPFPSPQIYPYGAITRVLSHDGRRLYVIDPLGTSIAVVNLAERRIERLFPLDAGDFASQLGNDPDQYLFGYSATLSVDGSRLYVAALEDDPFMSDSPWQSGIWIIDTTTWTIAEFLPIEGFVDTIHLAPQDNAIYAQVRSMSSAQQTIELVKVAVDGDPQVVERIQPPTTGPNPYWPHSLADLYRSQYSRSPGVDGASLVDSDTFSTLPRLEIQTSPTVLAPGQQATVEVRILDPASGDLLTTNREDVRFDAASGITAIVDSPEGDRQFLVLGQAEPGVYRGSVTVQTTGRWSVGVAVSDTAGQSWITPDTGQINVSQTFIGSDGRAYLFELTTDPEQPLADQNTTIRLRLIDAETSEPMPETVILAIARDTQDSDPLSDLPRRVDVRFLQGRQGVQTATLHQVTNGVYEGTTRFWSHGARNTTILIQPEGQPQMTIQANMILVGVE